MSPFADGHDGGADDRRDRRHRVGVMIASFRDWFALQLDDGRKLMVCLLRRRDGTVNRFSAWTPGLPALHGLLCPQFQQSWEG
jgi:hypothetical protein